MKLATTTFQSVTSAPIAFAPESRESSVTNLNPILADLQVLASLYKKSHWQVTGPTFYSLHLLFDKHYSEVAETIDTVAERIQALGGTTVATPQDVVELTRIPRAPQEAEAPPTQIQRLVEATEIVLAAVRAAAKEAAESGDDGTNDMLVGQVIRPSEIQSWFLREHLNTVK